MAVDHRLHVRPQLVDFAVDEPFDHAAAVFRFDRIGVKVVFHDVARGYQNRRERPGHQIAIWITWMTDAHVSVGIEYALLGRIRLAATRSSMSAESTGPPEVWDVCAVAGAPANIKATVAIARRAR